MKLSKAQQSVMDQAKLDIDRARSHSLMEWAFIHKCYVNYPKWQKDHTCREMACRAEDTIIAVNHSDYGMTYEQAVKKINKEIEDFAGKMKEYYEQERNAIVLTHCSSQTLEKLQDLGLIEILQDSKGESYGIDTIRVLNY